MSRIYVARRPNRRGLLLPQLGSRANPSLLFPLDGLERGELDELIRAILAKQGVTDEREISQIIEKAEQDSEVRIKVTEARKEVRRLMKLRGQGLSLIQRGFRKWSECFYPARKIFKK
jgi:hypothetical protein